MVLRRLLLVLFALAYFGVRPAFAQQAATLVADTVTVTDEGQLLATGAVEVLFDGNRLSATAITYDQASDRLTITGPILIRAADGTIFTAVQASLDPRLENGILIGARLVLAQQLQLGASQIDRVDGRYTQLSQVAATSCHVCSGRAPLWEIRARRVIHDQTERQLYFENATFRVRGLPILWIPRMRLPDPSLTRATGLLIPRYRSNDQFGFGVKLPYFIRMGDYRDLTLTPYFAPRTTTLEWRYRQAFARGDLEISGAISRDKLLSDTLRGYLFADGNLDLGSGFKLDFGAQLTSDKAYLLDYSYAEDDRLESFARLNRVRENDLLLGDFTIYRSLRDTETTTSLPPVVTEVSYERRTYPAAIGGTLTYGATFDSYYRTNTAPGDAGRDVAQIGGSTEWQRAWVTSAGLVAQVQAGFAADYYETWQDPAYARSALRMTQNAGLVLRWPFAAVGTSGAAHVLEPMIAIGWAGRTGPVVANEDSLRTEFDEGNFYAFDHFAGSDAVETGAQIATGLSWSRVGAEGARSRIGFGRIWRDRDQTAATYSSGLDGLASDWLLSGQIDFPSGLSFDGRALFDDSFTVTKSAALIGWHRGKVNLDAAYVFLPTDLAEDRSAPVSEWTLDTAYQITDVWSLGLSGRYDIVTAAPSNAGLQIGWKNECVTVELSASRRYTSSTTVDPSTDYGLSIGLNGFSAGRSGAAPRRQCAN